MKVIYICGMGHNGSTILNLALGMSPNVVATSQLNDLLNPFDPETPENNVDAVSEPVITFWQQVLHKLTPQLQNLLRQANQSNAKEKNLLKMFFSKSARMKFCNDSLPLFEAVRELSGKNVIVDGSKNISRAISLTAYEKEVKVYYLHLIRDIRGYVNSRNKRNREKEKRNGYILSTLMWTAKNTFASLLLRLRTRRIIKVYYEDILMRPDEFMDRLEHFVGEEFPSTRQAFKGEIEIDADESFGFGGNRVLHSKKSRFRTGVLPMDGVYNSNAYWYLLGWIGSFWGYKRDPLKKFLPESNNA